MGHFVWKGEEKYGQVDPWLMLYPWLQWRPGTLAPTIIMGLGTTHMCPHLSPVSNHYNNHTHDFGENLDGDTFLRQGRRLIVWSWISMLESSWHPRRNWSFHQLSNKDPTTQWSWPWWCNEKINIVWKKLICKGFMKVVNHIFCSMSLSQHYPKESWNNPCFSAMIPNLEMRNDTSVNTRMFLIISPVTSSSDLTTAVLVVAYSEVA